MIFKRLFEKICRERLTAAIATLYEVNSFRLETIEEEIEQLQSDDNYVKNLALENKETIEDRCITSTEYNKLSKGEGISGIIQTHAENVIKGLTHDGKDKERRPPII